MSSTRLYIYNRNTMTIKVYKKRVHWYFKFKNTEIEFNETGDLFCNILQSLLDKDYFYFEISQGYNSLNAHISFSCDDEHRSYYKFKLYGRLVYDIINLTGNNWINIISVNIPKSLITQKDSDSLFYCRLK